MILKNPTITTVYDETVPVAADFLRRLPEIFESQGTVIYNKRNQIKVFEEKAQKFCVKQYAIPALGNRILYSIKLRTPKAQRHYEYAREILKRGFSTPHSYGYIIEYQKGFLSRSYSVCEMVENAQSVAEAIWQDKNLLRAFSAYTAKLHISGLMHRDYILNNVLFFKEKDDYRFILIDINRFIFRNRPLGVFLSAVNLMQPFHHENDIRAFVKEYEKTRPMPFYFENMVVLFRKLRTFYSHVKHTLKKLPGVRYLRGTDTNSQR